MESALLHTDRVLLPVFITALVGFVTAALSIIRLVNDKEGKTTDYRQAWCDSLRKSLAELTSSLNSLASVASARCSTTDELNGLLEQQEPVAGPWGEAEATIRDHLRQKLADEDALIRETRDKLYHAYALTRLHFKPADPSFAPIEKNFDLAMELVRSIPKVTGGPSAEGERHSYRERARSIVEEITNSAREIIKTEWEIVKRGERAYELTKRWSIFGGGAAFVILLVLGGAAVAAFTKADDVKRQGSDVTSPGQPIALQTEPVDTTRQALPNVTQVVNLQPPICPATYAAPKTPPPARPRPTGECSK